MPGNNIDKYRFPKTLSEQTRIMGLPLDEFIPAALSGGILMLNKSYMFGMVVAVVLWQAIRIAKRGKSSKWLYNWC